MNKRVFGHNSHKLFLAMLLFAWCKLAFTQGGTWTSKTTGGNISYKISESAQLAKDFSGKVFTVVYLENLGFEKIGNNTNQADVDWLLEQGYRVIELDYRHHANAVSPFINADIIKINNEIGAGTFCELTNSSLIRSYVLFEGYRINRNVSYFKDDPTVYNKPDQYTEGDSLYMDIIYPANADVEVPVVVSFSYSNSFATYDGNTGKLTDANRHQRFSQGNMLAGFDDSFLEGAPANGIAWAIADHPKYCPWGGGKPLGGPNDAYKSYQTNPDAAQKVKSAVRTLRSEGEKLGLSGKIGVYGFSRGSDAGSMAIGDKQVEELENAGINQGVSDDVQAAALGPGVFDFTQIYNRTGDGDGNLELRCPWAWGPLEENYELWKSMGSEYLVETAATAPVLFFYNTTDHYYYRDQIKHLKDKLDSLEVPTQTLIDYGHGHSVPTIDTSLTQLYDFFIDYLNATVPEKVDQPQSNAVQAGTKESAFNMWPNPTSGEVTFTLHSLLPASTKLNLYNQLGQVVANFNLDSQSTGVYSATFNLNELALPNGLYFVQGNFGSINSVKKLLKV